MDKVSDYRSGLRGGITKKNIRKVQETLNCDYYTAEQLIRETNNVEEAIQQGRVVYRL